MIVSSAKLVEALTPPMPLELRQFGLELVSDVIIARGERIEHRRGEHARQATQ